MRKIYAIWAATIAATHLTMQSLGTSFWLSFAAFMAATVAIALKWGRQEHKDGFNGAYDGGNDGNGR